MTAPQRYYFGAAAVVAVTVIATLIAYPQLPGLVPMHAGPHGHMNDWGPKWSLFLYTPALMIGIVSMFVVLPRLSPKRFQMNSFRPAYLYIMIVIVALLAYSQLLVLLSGLGITVEVTRALAGGVCLLITLFGNVLGRIRRISVLGIRTPWTRAGKHVWKATHRFAARTIVAGGIFGLLGAISHVPFWLPVTAILISLLAPMFYSLAFYKQLERRGVLS
jgi:uncharacterized membrane protein